MCTVLNCLKDRVGFNKIQFEAIQELSVMWANISRSIAQVMEIQLTLTE